MPAGVSEMPHGCYAGCAAIRAHLEGHGQDHLLDRDPEALDPVPQPEIRRVGDVGTTCSTSGSVRLARARSWRSWVSDSLRSIGVSW